VNAIRVAVQQDDAAAVQHAILRSGRSRIKMYPYIRGQMPINVTGGFNFPAGATKATYLMTPTIWSTT